ncbi:MAG: rhodanese-like domain-containing protein [bacterium]|nr:rhodanese-like domain-containing protein [bacterium]
MIENARSPHTTCEIADLKAGLESDLRPLVIDVRMPEIFANQHVSGAVNIPTAEMTDRQAELPEDRDHPIVTVCNRGNLSLQGMLVLQSLGYRNVRSLNGGTVAWAEEGLPTGD